MAEEFSFDEESMRRRMQDLFHHYFQPGPDIFSQQGQHKQVAVQHERRTAAGGNHEHKD